MEYSRVQLVWLSPPQPEGSNGLPGVCHPPQHTGTFWKTKRDTAFLPGKEAALDGRGFPTLPAPQPSRLSHELAVVFAKLQHKLESL